MSISSIRCFFNVFYAKLKEFCYDACVYLLFLVYEQ